MKRVWYNRDTMAAQNLLSRIQTKHATIGVIGLGYVGLPLAILASQKGYPVVGFVRDSAKLSRLMQGNTSVDTVLKKDLLKVLRSKKLSLKKLESGALGNLDVIIICVPTPITDKKKPDLSAMESVAHLLSSVDTSRKLIINESTVAPGTTAVLLADVTGFLACSPERVDPGNRTSTTATIPKVVGGINEQSSMLASFFYKNILDAAVVSVSSLEVAEMAKMLENTYRAVNIALVNEFAVLAETLGIDITEVIRAASTKWSFHAHAPGIGVGGHCIPVDPYYILDLGRAQNVPLRVTETALATNEAMPEHLLQHVLQSYKKGMKVLVYGLTYKRDVADTRESPALTFCELLKQKDIPFTVFDPMLSDARVRGYDLVLGNLAPVDILVVATDHSRLATDAKKLIRDTTIVIDGRNAFAHKTGKVVIGVGRKLS